MSENPLVELMKKACSMASTTVIRDFFEIEALQSAQKKQDEFVERTYQKARDKMTIQLLKAYPNYDICFDNDNPIQSKAPCRWLISSIDSKDNFIRGNSNFAISITLQRFDDGRRPVLGVATQVSKYRVEDLMATVIVFPATNQTYFAIKGRGAFYLDQYETQQKIRVSRRNTLQHSVCSVSPSHISDSGIISFIRANDLGLRISGSVITDAVSVSRGKSDFAFIDTNNIAETAATVLLVQEAGGVAFTPERDRVNLGESSQFIASNENFIKVLENLDG